ncbi:hypothetical protein KZO01_12080 [Kurthia zopfii]|uniref:LPXTG-motif cell wall-anchored protein n=1 Tax=Kurthia zopfii TaxID=1650 RepID=A0A8B4Q778_9BACL|nr:LPXTG cell wall anchor domain-containing protein [Kurthia zopfii]PWI22105.1 hypothetical protein DF281_08855 [Kurthia zopfii]TDR37800.1 LPXTG-motif cell wall-anchored protein [Kurthia zopfii]GEK30899.1 hypothetical protein KZO01_12080 [Kurthia zopfii]STX08476.1 Uncharacterised protein [Kurthia zopfii]
MTKVPHYKNSVKVEADEDFLLTNTYVPPKPPPGEGTPPPLGEAGDDEFGPDSENPLAGGNGTNKPTHSKPDQQGKPAVDEDQALGGKLPQTSEESYIASIILGAVFILGAVLLIKRHRKIINYIDED